MRIAARHYERRGATAVDTVGVIATAAAECIMANIADA